MGEKKIIPKIKKKLVGFLSDESGKVSKEDILKIGLMSIGMGMMSSPVSTDAASVYGGSYTHGNACVGHGNNNLVDGSCASTHCNNGFIPSLDYPVAMDSFPLLDTVFAAPIDGGHCSCDWYDPPTGGGHANSPAYYQSATANPVNEATNGHVNMDVGMASATLIQVNSDSYADHINQCAIHANCNPAFVSAAPGFRTTNDVCHANNPTTYYTSASALINQNVNGHLNASPSANLSGPVNASAVGHGNQTHSSHGSHGSHGSHCSW